MKRQTWYDVKGSDTDDWDESSRPAIVELQYTYDNSHNVRRREDIRGDNSVGLATRDEQYEYDGLDRLATAQRGFRNHSTGAFTVAGDKGQDWTLDALGNWMAIKTDIDGDGDFDGSDRADARTFTLANEVIDQTLTNPNYPDELAFEFDHAGNQTGREVNPDRTGADGKWIYIYDAWNRLVEVRIDSDGDGSYDEVRVRYGYNGLHQRSTRRANSNDQVINGDDPGHLYYYDASWRMLEERIDEAWDGANNTFAPDEIVQRIWDPLYIDALIAMQTDVNDDLDSGDPDGDFTDADAVVHYAILDRKYDVVAMMNAAGVIRERVRYTPYGVARHSPGGADLNGDGMVNGSDQATVLATWGAMGTANYSPASDFDRDGDVDGADLSYLFANWSATAEPEGALSRIGNTIGYSGYVYDDAINASLARFRWYDAEMGRWMTRDPLEYFAGMNTFEYVQSTPNVFCDPFGLDKTTFQSPTDPYPLITPGTVIPNLRELERRIREDGLSFDHLRLSCHGSPGTIDFPAGDFPNINPGTLKDIERYRANPDDFPCDRQKSLKELDDILKTIFEASNGIEFYSCNTGGDDPKKTPNTHDGDELRNLIHRLGYLDGGKYLDLWDNYVGPAWYPNLGFYPWNGRLSYKRRSYGPPTHGYAPEGQ